MTNRVTHLAGEVLSESTGKPRVSQVGGEVLSESTGKPRASYLVIEMLTNGSVSASRLSHFAIEVLSDPGQQARRRVVVVN